MASKKFYKKLKKQGFVRKRDGTFIRRSHSTDYFVLYNPQSGKYFFGDTEDNSIELHLPDNKKLKTLINFLK